MAGAGADISIIEAVRSDLTPHCSELLRATASYSEPLRATPDCSEFLRVPPSSSELCSHLLEAAPRASDALLSRSGMLRADPNTNGVLQVVLGCSERFRGAPRGSELFQSCSKLFGAANSSSELFRYAHSCSELFIAAQSCAQLLNAALLLIAAHSCS